MGFAMRLGKKSMVGWIGAVRPSRRPLSRPPQDEELSQCHQVLILILRSGQRARLEGRKAVMQPLRLNSCLASMLNPSYGSSRGNHVIVSAPNLEARLRRRSGARLPSPSALPTGRGTRTDSRHPHRWEPAGGWWKHPNARDESGQSGAMVGRSLSRWVVARLSVLAMSPPQPGDRGERAEPRARGCKQHIDSVFGVTDHCERGQYVPDGAPV